MKFVSMDHWDEKIWVEVSKLYKQSFGKKGRKPENVIRNMFLKELAHLHLVYLERRIIAFAITGKLHKENALLIDYIAVNVEDRNQGIGAMLIHYIKDWAARDFSLLVIEVESELNLINNSRINFWKKCGFILNDYVHHYIWVPETYQAMYLPLTPLENAVHDGRELFNLITRFHQTSFRGVK